MKSIGPIYKSTGDEIQKSRRAYQRHDALIGFRGPQEDEVELRGSSKNIHRLFRYTECRMRHSGFGYPRSLKVSTWFYKHKENQDESPSSIKPSARAIHCLDEASRSGTEQYLYED